MHTYSIGGVYTSHNLVIVDVLIVLEYTTRWRRTLQRYRDPFDPGGQFDALLDGLEIDDDALLIPHG